MTNPDLTPDIDEIYQAEEHALPLTPIPVTIEGPVRSQDLPSKTMVVTQLFLDSTGGFIQPQRLLGDDPRRKIARLVASDQKIRIGTSQKQVMNADTCAIWPVGVVLPITATTEVWVAADTLTTRISCIAEQWAD